VHRQVPSSSPAHARVTQTAPRDAVASTPASALAQSLPKSVTVAVASVTPPPTTTQHRLSRARTLRPLPVSLRLVPRRLLPLLLPVATTLHLVLPPSLLARSSLPAHARAMRTALLDAAASTAASALVPSLHRSAMVAVALVMPPPTTTLPS
jgi:hypothetical protein